MHLISKCSCYSTSRIAKHATNTVLPHMHQFNDHSSVNSKSLRTMLLEKFHHKFLHSKTGPQHDVAPNSPSPTLSMNDMRLDIGNAPSVDRMNLVSMSPEDEQGNEERYYKDSTTSSLLDERDVSMTDINEVSRDIPYQSSTNQQAKQISRKPALNCNITDAINWSTTEQQVSTPLMTPVTQSVPPFYSRRHDSVSSLASSISELPYSTRPSTATNGMAPNPAPAPAPFSQQFVSLLLEMYLQVCSDPTITPFDTNNPPSGILHKVSKAAVEKAEGTNVDIGVERNAWLLTLVRQRLIKEVRKESYLSRNSSIISLPPVPQFGVETISSCIQPQTLSHGTAPDYFSCNATDTPNLLAYSAAYNNFSGLNSPFDSKQSYQQLQQPLQMSQLPSQAQVQQQQPLYPKSLARSRNNSFITAASRSRSNSFKVYPQLSGNMNASQTQQLPNLTRSRSASNTHFALTPTSSTPSQPFFLLSQTNNNNVNSSYLQTTVPTTGLNTNTTAAGQQSEEKTSRLPTHLETDINL